ncbi:MAG TPA: hypothetical protein VK673_06840, partial [Chthoniobacterales bacterium]|nr:hypothetical protein [Chthoniobacterales bacterium]
GRAAAALTGPAFINLTVTGLYPFRTFGAPFQIVFNRFLRETHDQPKPSSRPPIPIKLLWLSDVGTKHQITIRSVAVH